jgi:hypothetical protein
MSNAWNPALNHEVGHNQVAQEIQQSEQSRNPQAQARYQDVVHRNADPSGPTAFVTFLPTAGTLKQVNTTLTISSDSVRGRGTKDGSVTALYKDTPTRSPDSSALAAHTNALNPGISPRQVATGVVEGTENRQNAVANSYKEFLKRPADNGGLNTYVAALKGGVLNQDNVATAMLGSEEFLSPIRSEAAGRWSNNLHSAKATDSAHRA